MNSNLFYRISTMRWSGGKLFQRDISEFYDSSTKAGRKPVTGRAWSTSELRLKSFSDLHKLWFVLIKEKNVLLTEALQCKSKSIPFVQPSRLKKTKLSMTRIKVVLHERAQIYKQIKKDLLKAYLKLRKDQNKIKADLEKAEMISEKNVSEREELIKAYILDSKEEDEVRIMAKNYGWSDKRIDSLIKKLKIAICENS